MRKIISAGLILLALAAALLMAVGSATADNKDKDPTPKPTATAEEPKPTETPKPPKPTDTPEGPKPTATEKPPHNEKDDLDQDGCDTKQEESTDPTGGGERDPKNHWDFFDTPKPGVPEDKVIQLDDIYRVAGRFATVGDPNGDPMSPPPPTGYHAAYDRTYLGPDPWDLGPPDGNVGLSEIFWDAKQFAHSCA